MTVVDSSVVVDFLLGVGAASQLQPLLDETADADLATAPDVLVFEVLSGMPLVTKDRRLARAARLHTDVDVIELD